MSNLYIVYAAAFFYLVTIISVIPRRNNLIAEVGALRMKFFEPKTVGLRAIAIFLFAAAIIIVMTFRDFGLFVNAIICLCGILAANMAATELSMSGMAGIYDNFIINNNQKIKIAEITSLPTLEYENDEETTNVDFRTLRVILNDKTEKLLIFKDEAERKTALAILFELLPPSFRA